MGRLVYMEDEELELLGNALNGYSFYSPSVDYTTRMERRKEEVKEKLQSHLKGEGGIHEGEMELIYRGMKCLKKEIRGTPKFVVDIMDKCDKVQEKLKRYLGE